MNAYLLCVWIHVLAATVWVGSMVFFAVAIVPALRRSEIRSAAPALLEIVGARFRMLGTISLVVLLVTGAIQLTYHGIGWSDFVHASFANSDFGRTLLHKLALVAVVVAATGAHEFITRRGAAAHRRAASWIGRIMLIASIGILYFAVRLARGL